MDQVGAGAAAWMLGDHHRVAAGFADAGGEAAAAQVLGGPIGGAAAVAGVVGLGADAGDAQEVEQPGMGGIARGVQPGEHLIEQGSLVCHGRYYCAARLARKAPRR